MFNQFDFAFVFAVLQEQDARNRNFFTDSTFFAQFDVDEVSSFFIGFKFNDRLAEGWM